jgi:predicted nucleotidyltransferase
MNTPISILEVARRADLFFMNASPIHETMRRLAKVLREMNIRFAIAGAMAANAHGHQRTTSDVDILIRKEDLERFKEAYRGRGWVDVFEGSKNFRDAVTNIKIDALIVGAYPGDGKPKPIAFPPPEEVSSVNDEGISILNLRSLIELKVACGMTTPQQPRDFDDVIQLIRINRLPQEYAKSLNPYVAAKFDELWQAAQVSDDY